ncbi:MAG: dockerin type I repeat-containing protein [Muribaculaceae bacterium]|nr:dockerin type I repeat-containing protein [Muribaculaceae bacterium]
MMHQLGVNMYFNPNTLPAFTLSYYTNDVKGVVTGAGGELALSDGENTLTKTVAAGEEFAFENVDYTKTYTLSLNGEVVAEDLAFDDITKDLYVEIASSGTTPVAGDVNGDGNVTAADVTALYNFILNNDTSNLVNGDQNGDGDITSSDVTVVYNILLGTE